MLGLMKQLDLIYQVIPDTEQSFYKDLFNQLSSEQFKKVLNCVEEHQDLIKAHPKLMQAVLTLAKTSNEHGLKVLSEVLKSIAAHKDSDPELLFKVLKKECLAARSLGKELINARVVLVYLLNQKLLVQQGIWSEELNQNLLSRSFDAYVS
ncbi:MAG: hypothetical protein ACRCXC_09020 [Legionella sp.]